ncbi:hypothetical protein CES86_1886 [Brucella lupini]|uniref:Uncharacterized protein n=1 Tax=Brucella lupini TaxID=255457 RepID=A0A256GVI0_9HYPH|nr:hypothetical protein CES86_1886 [Brucella lupini]
MTRFKLLFSCMSPKTAFRFWETCIRPIFATANVAPAWR